MVIQGRSLNLLGSSGDYAFPIFLILQPLISCKSTYVNIYNINMLIFAEYPLPAYSTIPSNTTLVQLCGLCPGVNQASIWKFSFPSVQPPNALSLPNFGSRYIFMAYFMQNIERHVTLVKTTYG